MKILLIIFSLVYIIKLYFYNNYCINITSSVPKGIYKLYKPTQIKRQDYVFLEIPDNAKNIIWGREYLPKHIKFLVKRVKGVPKDEIIVKNKKLYINKVFMGNIKLLDSNKKKLISNLQKNKFYLKKNEYILLGTDDSSYDSRYFGVITKDKILKKAKLIRKI